MKYNCLFFIPGVFWRFLAANDKDYDIVYIKDMDAPFDLENQKIKNLIKISRETDNDIQLIRPFAAHGDLSVPPDTIKYAMLQACDLCFKPKNLKYSIEFLLKSYIDLFETGEINSISSPEKFPWGEFRYPNYGFGEDFLDTVIYPLISRSGSMVTRVNKNTINPLDLRHKADLDFQIKYGNKLIYI